MIGLASFAQFQRCLLVGECAAQQVERPPDRAVAGMAVAQRLPCLVGAFVGVDIEKRAVEVEENGRVFHAIVTLMPLRLFALGSFALLLFAPESSPAATENPSSASSTSPARACATR